MVFTFEQVCAIILGFSSVAGAYYYIYDRTSRYDERQKASEAELEAMKENIKDSMDELKEGVNESLRDISLTLKETSTILQQMQLKLVEHIAKHN